MLHVLPTVLRVCAGQEPRILGPMPPKPQPLLAVPNFSTGRDEVEARSLASHPTLIDLHSDPDHNRTVATYGGRPDAVVDACLGLVERAVSRLDLSSHQGAHPRFGVMDVLPLVPYGAGEEVAVRSARHLAEVVESELEIPVFTYGRASEDGTTLVELRAQLRSQRNRHPTAGVLCLGIRDPLVAFNVNLHSNLGEAKAIASHIRAPRIRALGFSLPSRGLAQVSMNLVEPLELGPRRAFDLVASRTEHIADCEVVGLLPKALMPDVLGLPLRYQARSIEDALLESEGV
jgi:glutamate formiminotransferase